MSRNKNPNLNKWVGSEKTGTWEFSYYRYCYLTVRRLDNGKYKPMVGAIGRIETPDCPVPEVGYFQFDTLEEAQKFLYKYVDYVRDVWDVQAKEELHEFLNKNRPESYFA